MTNKVDELRKKIRGAIGWASPKHRIRDVEALITQEKTALLERVERELMGEAIPYANKGELEQIERAYARFRKALQQIKETL